MIITRILISCLVAEFPLWMAFPPGLAHWTAILATDQRPFSAPVNIDGLVDGYAGGLATGL